MYTKGRKNFKYNDKFDSRKIARFLKGKAFWSEMNLSIQAIRLNKKEEGETIEIIFSPHSSKRLMVKTFSKGALSGNIQIEGLEKVWYEYWLDRKVVVFEKKSGAQIAIVEDEEVGYKVSYYDWEFWGRAVG